MMWKSISRASLYSNGKSASVRRQRRRRRKRRRERNDNTARPWLTGRPVKLDRPHRCGSMVGIVAPGKGPHRAQLICAHCTKRPFIKWLSKRDFQTTAHAVADAIRSTGQPPEEITLIQDSTRAPASANAPPPAGSLVMKPDPAPPEARPPWIE